MINGAHMVVYSMDAEADRNFFRDVLGLSSVDAGHGWLIFGLPKAESAFHPAQTNDRHELYFMCDNLMAEIEALRARCRMLHRGRGALGLNYEDPTAGRRRDRPIPTQASAAVASAAIILMFVAIGRA